MVGSRAMTVSQYLKDIPPSQRAELQKVRAVMKKNLGIGFKEVLNWGMIAYEVSLST